MLVLHAFESGKGVTGRERRSRGDPRAEEDAKKGDGQ